MKSPPPLSGLWRIFCNLQQKSFTAWAWGEAVWAWTVRWGQGSPAGHVLGQAGGVCREGLGLRQGRPLWAGVWRRQPPEWNIQGGLESESGSRSVVSDSLWPQELYSPWNSLGQNTGMGILSLLQGIFPTQGSNPSLPHCGWILYQLSHKGKPKNTGVGSLSLLQRVFLTQELNRGLLHCRQVPYQLSCQGSPRSS